MRHPDYGELPNSQTKDERLWLPDQLERDQVKFGRSDGLLHSFPERAWAFPVDLAQ